MPANPHVSVLRPSSVHVLLHADPVARRIRVGPVPTSPTRSTACSRAVRRRPAAPVGAPVRSRAAGAGTLYRCGGPRCGRSTPDGTVRGCPAAAAGRRGPGHQPGRPAGGAALVATVHDLNVELFPYLAPQSWRSLYRRGLRLAVRTADCPLHEYDGHGHRLQQRYGVAAAVGAHPFGPGIDPTAPRDPAVLQRLGVRAHLRLDGRDARAAEEPAGLGPRLRCGPFAGGPPLGARRQPRLGAGRARAAVAGSGCPERIVVAGGLSLERSPRFKGRRRLRAALPLRRYRG